MSKILNGLENALVAAECEHAFIMTPKQPSDKRYVRKFCQRCETTFLSPHNDPSELARVTPRASENTTEKVDHVIIRLRRNADDCENMERWATPELAPLLREAAEAIDVMRTALMLAKSDLTHAVREIDRELAFVDEKTIRAHE